MALTFPVNLESKWTVYQLSTNSIIKRDKTWPNVGGDPVDGWFDPLEGLETADHKWLEQIEGSQPDYDSRLFVLQGTETIDLPNNTNITTWAAVARPLNERIEAAENEESYQLTRHVDIAREMVTTRLLLAAVLNNLINGENPPLKVRNMAQAHIDQTVKLWQNRDRLEAIIADINAGLDPNLDAGWAP